MAIEQRVDPYEVLIRFKPDGSVYAHAQSITRIIRDDIVISEQELDPTPISAAGPEFQELIGSALTQALSERDALRSQVLMLQAQISAAPSVPQVSTITALQVRLALASLGLDTAVQQWLETYPDPTIKLRFDWASTFDTSDPMFDLARTELGLSESDLESFFSTARSL